MQGSARGPLRLLGRRRHPGSEACRGRGPCREGPRREIRQRFAAESSPTVVGSGRAPIDCLGHRPRRASETLVGQTVQRGATTGRGARFSRRPRRLLHFCRKAAGLRIASPCVAETGLQGRTRRDRSGEGQHSQDRALGSASRVAAQDENAVPRVQYGDGCRGHHDGLRCGMGGAYWLPVAHRVQRIPRLRSGLRDNRASSGHEGASA